MPNHPEGLGYPHASPNVIPFPQPIKQPIYEFCALLIIPTGQYIAAHVDINKLRGVETVEMFLIDGTSLIVDRDDIAFCALLEPLNVATSRKTARSG